MKTIWLIKGKETFKISYDDESKVLDALTEMVHNPRLNFDWMDAEVLARELGRNLGKELKVFLNGNQ